MRIWDSRTGVSANAYLNKAHKINYLTNWYIWCLQYFSGGRVLALGREVIEGSEDLSGPDAAFLDRILLPGARVAELVYARDLMLFEHLGWKHLA